MFIDDTYILQIYQTWMFNIDYDYCEVNIIFNFLSLEHYYTQGCLDLACGQAGLH